MSYFKSVKSHLILSFLQLFVALGAIPSGLLLVLDVSGKTIGLNSNILSQSPFKNFLLPGIFLFLLGVLHLITAIYSYKNKSFIGLYGKTTGIILLLWLGIQIYLIGLNHVLQAIMIMVGIFQFFIAHRVSLNKNNLT